MTYKSGEKFDMMTIEFEQTRLDTEATKAFFDRLLSEGRVTQEEVSACFSTSSVIQLRTSRKDQYKAEKPKFVPPTLGDNITAAACLDLFAEAKEREGIAKREAGFYREAFEGRMRAEGTPLTPESATPSSEAPERFTYFPGKGTSSGFDTEES